VIYLSIENNCFTNLATVRVQEVIVHELAGQREVWTRRDTVTCS